MIMMNCSTHQQPQAFPTNLKCHKGCRQSTMNSQKRICSQYRGWHMVAAVSLCRREGNEASVVAEMTGPGRCRDYRLEPTGHLLRQSPHLPKTPAYAASLSVPILQRIGYAIRWRLEFKVHAIPDTSVAGCRVPDEHDEMTRSLPLKPSMPLAEQSVVEESSGLAEYEILARRRQGNTWLKRPVPQQPSGRACNGIPHSHHIPASYSGVILKHTRRAVLFSASVWGEAAAEFIPTSQT